MTPITRPGLFFLVRVAMVPTATSERRVRGTTPVLEDVLCSLTYPIYSCFLMKIRHYRMKGDVDLEVAWQVFEDSER